MVLFCSVESEEFENNDNDDNNSSNESHASSPDHLEVEFSSLSDDPGLETDHNHTDSPETLQELGEKFLLKIKHKNSLSEKTIHSIAICTSELISATVTRLKNGLKKCLNSADVDMNEIDGLEEVFDETDDLCKATKTFSCTSVDGSWKESAGYVVRDKSNIAQKLDS